MSQAGSYGLSGGGGSVTFTADTGSPITGSAFTLFANVAALNCGSTVSFITSAPDTITFSVTDGGSNTIIGQASGVNGSSAVNNTVIGAGSLSSIVSGASNSVVGVGVLGLMTTGDSNVGIGTATLGSLVTGNFNTVVGTQSATAYTSNESSNIIIGYLTPGTVTESNVLRIGNGTGTSPGNLNAAYICGISGKNVGSVATVVTESSNQLGTATITAGTGITVTPGANTITISASSSGGFTWNNQNSSTVSMVVNNGYVINNGAS